MKNLINITFETTTITTNENFKIEDLFYEFSEYLKKFNQGEVSISSVVNIEKIEGLNGND